MASRGREPLWSLTRVDVERYVRYAVQSEIHAGCLASLSDERTQAFVAAVVRRVLREPAILRLPKGAP